MATVARALPLVESNALTAEVDVMDDPPVLLRELEATDTVPWTISKFNPTDGNTDATLDPLVATALPTAELEATALPPLLSLVQRETEVTVLHPT